jgi:hypothetical protein
MITIEKDATGISHVKALVTDFTEAMGYCEFKIPFFINGIKEIETEQMIFGTQFYGEAQKINAETSIMLPLSKTKLRDKKADLSLMREDIQTQFTQEVRSSKGKSKLTLFGRADKIFRKNGTLIISDDRITSNPSHHESRIEPYNDHLLQILTYLHSKYYLGDSFGGWTQIPHKRKSYQINIIDSKTKRIQKTYEEIVSPRHENLLFNSTIQFSQKCLQWLELNHHNSKKKCEPCRFFNDCEKALR